MGRASGPFRLWCPLARASITIVNCIVEYLVKLERPNADKYPFWTAPTAAGVVAALIMHSAHTPTITFAPAAPETHIELVQSAGNSSTSADVTIVSTWVHDLGRPTQLLVNLGIPVLVR